MNRVLVLVEGQTEEQFIEEVLRLHLWGSSIDITPVILKTGQSLQGRGGVSKYSRIRGDILRLLEDTSAALVTTMLDYYGLPRDFPGKSNLVSTDPYQRVAHLEKAFELDIGNSRFLPFLMLHEFECLLFADIEKLFEVIPDVPKQKRKVLQQWAKQPPETINDSESGHPSRRIQQCIPGYAKLLHGVLAVKRIGLATVRRKCPHFNDWLTNLEKR
jgi:hypothetical protein